MYFSVLQTQEREAKENMKRKAKELHKQRQEAGKYGRNPGYSGISSSSSGGRQDVQIIETTIDKPKPSYTTPGWVQNSCAFGSIYES